MKQLILEKNEIYKKYVNKNKEPKIFEKAKCLRNDLDSIIESNKKNTTPAYQKSWLIQWPGRNPIGQL